MNTLRRASSFVLVTALGLALGACGAAVAPLGDGGGDGGSSLDAPSGPDSRPVEPMDGCRLPDGGVAAVGAVVPAGDGCNTCRCERGGMLGCTLIGCVDSGARDDGTARDTGPLVGGCQLNEECSGGRLCEAPPGCGTPGVCVPARPCTDDIAVYCMCDGTTRRGGSSCPPGVFRSRGPCGEDAGADAVPPPMRDCDVRRALCNTPAPRCPLGMTNVVRGSCWGECVPVGECGPITCDPDSIAMGPSCPQNTECDRGTRRCRAR